MEKKRDFLLLIYPEALTRNPGSIRVERILRSLSTQKKVVLLTKGPKKEIKKTPWGFLLTTEKATSSPQNLPPKKNIKTLLSSLKSKLANTLLSPDAGLWWNKKVLKEEAFSPYFKLCNLVMSTSPPHSVHLLAYELQKKYKMKWFMDMRDGWLDEPLKKTLLFLKPLEKKQEAKCLLTCDTVIANTKHWARHLKRRYPELENKIKVIPNSIGEDLRKLCQEKKEEQRGFLLHSGSFRISDSRRKLQYVLEPLLKELKSRPSGRIILIGKLNLEDKKELSFYQKENSSISIEAPGEVSKEVMAQYLREASGFFLSSHSYSALPSKFLDYLTTSKPILCFCKKGSSLDETSKKISSCYRVDLENPSLETLRTFLEKTRAPQEKRKEGELLFLREKTFKEELLSLL